MKRRPLGGAGYTEHPAGMFMSNRHKSSRPGKDSVGEQLEEGKDTAEWREMRPGVCTGFRKPRPSL